MALKIWTLSIDDEGNGAIIDKMNLHHGAKTPRLDDKTRFLHLCNECLIESVSQYERSFVTKGALFPSLQSP